MNSTLLTTIQRELTAEVDEAYRIGSMNFFKEKIRPRGVRSGMVRQIGRRSYREIKNLPRTEFYRQCEQLLKTGWMEETAIAFQWTYARRRTFTDKDFALFERWLKAYVSNWAHCDDFCTHVIVYLLEKYPEIIPKTGRWASSKKRWLRRAAAVSLIYPVRRKKHLDRVFTVADSLLTDRDDLVQKGYGWMLKEASNQFPKEVLAFIMKRKQRMPRTALRYAIEKYPVAIRKKALLRT